MYDAPAPLPAKPVRRIAILTGGGDCPGLNGVIRAVTRTAILQFGADVIGIEDGFEGLVEGRQRALSLDDTIGILSRGGTILGTSNKGDPWRFPARAPDGTITHSDRSGDALRHLRDWGVDALIAVGGDGTMAICSRFIAAGLPVIGVPKTIDNDVPCTDVTFGFDSAASIVCESIDRLATTASAHHRVMVVEVMGRYAGWLALIGGIGGGAHVILIPEIPFQWAPIVQKVRDRVALHKRYSIVCVAEGARLPDGGEVVAEHDARRTDPKRLGGIGALVARELEQRAGLETRVTVLGHLQRGGAPSLGDRVLTTRLGHFAARLACEGGSGVMVAVRDNAMVPVPLADVAAGGNRRVSRDDPALRAAREIGVVFGD
jgi:6-phosphofructokinase 1